MTSRSFTRAPFPGVALASPASSSAQMRLSPLIGDGMAIQRGVQVPVRDWMAAVVAIDLDEAGDAQPRNEQDVGARLAPAARRVAYAEDLVHSGSAPARHPPRGGGGVMRLRGAGRGLVRHGARTRTGPTGSTAAAAAAVRLDAW